MAETIKTRLSNVGYVASESLATAIDLMLELTRPLLLEGEAGVGKTEVAKSLAQILGTNLIRLQCYEGLDAANAIYEWNYQKQLLAIKISENQSTPSDKIKDHIFSEEYLLTRPLLQAIRQKKQPVLLIDEVDRADMEFEAYLLEILSDYQITVPELGTIKATSIPHVILTSNGTRELSDALRRRCLYSYVDFPTPETERDIILSRIPKIDLHLANQISIFVSELRKEDLEKLPGMAETLDWAHALYGMKISSIDSNFEKLQQSLICLLKTERDLKSVTSEVTSRLAGKAA